MTQRCFNPKAAKFPNYGARGITVCEQWLDFAVFYADMGDPPPGMSIDRINNDGNYEPGNCRWATPKEQARNRRSSQPITFDGETLLLIEWAKKLGLHYRTLWGRLAAGWSIDRAFTTPTGPNRGS